MEHWLKGGGHREIGRQLNLPKSTVKNIVNKFLERGDSKHRNGGCKTRTARTDDLVMYTEYCKQQQPSLSAEEIQGKLLENNVCLIQNIPSKSSITRIVREDLGYSYKQLKVVARVSLSVECEQRLVDYLSICSTLDTRNMRFFDERSVIKTTGNRHYGHSAVGSPAVEVQHYPSNANYTVNLLHSISGINHLNILDGPSDGLELLNLF